MWDGQLGHSSNEDREGASCSYQYSVSAFNCGAVRRTDGAENQDQEEREDVERGIIFLLGASGTACWSLQIHILLSPREFCL